MCKNACFKALGAFAFIMLLLPVAALAESWRVALETGGVWQHRNDVRIPGDDGTRFALDDITGAGPNPFIRLEVDWQFASRHGLRIVYAPLSIDESGTLDAPVDFVDTRFEAGPTQAYYQFNAPRLTYRYTVADGDRHEVRIGATALVRDAEVRLEQPGRTAKDTDVGFVPLLHLSGRYRIADDWHLVLELDGLAAPQGRAFDLGLRLERRLASGWDIFAGYRTLEGGVDNDDVFNFSWFNYAVIGAAWRL